MGWDDGRWPGISAWPPPDGHTLRVHSGLDIRCSVFLWRKLLFGCFSYFETKLWTNQNEMPFRGPSHFRRCRRPRTTIGLIILVRSAVSPRAYWPAPRQRPTSPPIPNSGMWNNLSEIGDFFLFGDRSGAAFQQQKWSVVFVVKLRRIDWGYVKWRKKILFKGDLFCCPVALQRGTGSFNSHPNFCSVTKP